MITNIGLYFLYRHIRLDTNEVFYVGIGKKRLRCISRESVYERAYSQVSRNPFWKNIVAKTEYEVEIMLESDSLDFIREKEKEFISIYQRKDCCFGTLTNLTDGGEGFHSKHTEDTKIKIKKSKRVRKNRIVNEIKEEVIKLYTEGKTIRDICNLLLIGKTTVSEIVKPFIRNSANYKFKTYYVYNFDDNSITEINESLENISIRYKISKACVKNHIKNKGKIRNRLNFLILLDKVSIEEAFRLFNNKLLNKSKTRSIETSEVKERRIIQKNLQGEVVKIWDCMQDILNEYNLKTSTPILRVIKKERKKYKNSTWERYQKI